MVVGWLLDGYWNRLGLYRKQNPGYPAWHISHLIVLAGNFSSRASKFATEAFLFYSHQPAFIIENLIGTSLYSIFYIFPSCLTNSNIDPCKCLNYKLQLYIYIYDI